MKMMNMLKKYAPRVNKYQAAAGGGLMLLASAVMAEVPAEVKTSLATAKTDSLEVAGLVLGIIVAIFAFMLMRRVLK